MASSRHFFKSQPVSQTRAEIEADIRNSRTAQLDLQAVGQYRLAEDMRQATDEAIDELNDLNNGRWTPRYA